MHTPTPIEKLNKRQTDKLMTILRNLEQSRAYIHRPDMALTVRGKATTTLHYTRQDGEALYEIERAYGSDLVKLDTAIQSLRLFLGFRSGDNHA